MLRPAVGLALCAALTASAQSVPSSAAAPAPVPETSATPTRNAAATRVLQAAPTAPSEDATAGFASREQMAAFLEQFLAFDEKTGEVYTGRARRPVARTELYQLLGRPDLQLQTEGRSRTRTWLYVGAAASLAAGLGSGVYLHSTLPNLEAGKCVRGVYSAAFADCAPLHARQSAIGSGLIAVGSGAALAMALAAFSFELHPVPRAEVARLVSTYNGELRKRLRSTGAAASAPSAQLTVAPVAGPAGPGLHAHLTF